MGDAYGILGSYEEGKTARKKKNYLQAARCFRMCRYYYEQSELPVYYIQVEFYAMRSYHWFDYCKSKLTEEAQEMLEKEESEFHGNWRDFVRFDQQKIDEETGTPSPNKPTKRKIFMKKMLSYIKRFGNKVVSLHQN